MKSILRKKSLAATILIYSCIIFIIPTVTIFTKLYFSDIKKLKESIDNKNIKEVQYLSSIIEKKIEALDMIAIRISQEKKTSKFYMASGLTEEIDGISEIAKYKEISGFVDDILVYFKNDDYIYSTEGRSSFDTMFNLIYQYPASVRYEIINNLKNLNDPMLEKKQEVLVKGTDKQNIITYLYPIHIEYQKKYLTVAFIISDKSIMNAISDNYNLNNMDIFIIDEDNNVLATMGSNGFIKGQISPKFFTGLEKNEISTATYDKQKYVLTNSNIKDTGLTIVMAANEKELYKTVRTSRTSLLVLIFVLLIIGVTLIMLIVLKSNKQILKIKSQLGISSDGDIFAGSELDQIITWVDNIIIQKEMIEAKYNSNNKLVKNQLLEMLFKGEISNISNLKGWGDDSELELVKGWFSVFAMKPYEDKCRMYYEWDVDILNSVLSKYPNLNTLELSDENVFVLIICADSAKKVEEFELEIISVIQNIYPNHFVKIGIGKRYGQISYLNNSFFEAQIALDNIINKNNQLLR